MSPVLKIGRPLLLGAALVVLAFVASSGEAVAAPATPCPAGKALYDSGRFAAAEAAYTEALKEPTSEPCAKAGLRELDANANECATAVALEAADREAEARAAYEKALATKPDSECANKGIEEPDESFLESIVDDPKKTAEDLVAWILLLVLGLGLFALVVLLLILVMSSLPVVRNWWPASRIRTVQVGIEPFEDSATPSQGSALAALVRSKIESFGTGSETMKMVDSKAAIEETIWTKFGAISDQAKTFSDLIGLIVALYPYRRFQASGVLQSDNGSGPGVTLSFREAQKIAGAATLWPQQFGLEAGDDGDAAKADRLQKLSVPVAAWISHTTATAAGKTPGGARDPISWALFKTGEEWERDGDIKKAVSLYKAAIDRDPSNWGALVQLGKLEDEAHEYEQAIMHLRAALEILEA